MYAFIMLKFYYLIFIRELHPSKKEQLEQFKKHLIDSSKEIPNLKVWELQGNLQA